MNRGIKEVALNLNDLINKNWFLSRLIGTPVEAKDPEEYKLPTVLSKQEDYEDKTPESIKR